MQRNQNQKESAADMKVIGSGKTVVEAQADALAKLEEIAGPFQRHEVELVVISEGSKGFLGVGSQMAQVEASLPGEKGADLVSDGEYYRDEPQPHPEEEAFVEEEIEPAGAEAEERLAQYLSRVLEGFQLNTSVSVSDRHDALVANVSGDGLGLLIGRHGQTIDAVQYLANIIVFRGMQGRKRIVVDAEDYRVRRSEVLRSLAERGASEVLKGKPRYELSPMTASERRIIHMYLQDHKGIETTSEGNEPFRRVVIILTGNA